MLRRFMLMGVAAAGTAAFAGVVRAQGGTRAAAEAERGGAAQHSVQLAPGVTFTVTELRRVPDKGVMELKFVVANESQGDVTLKDFGLTNKHFGSKLDNIAVVDFAGRKKYDIGEAAGCLCSTFRDGSGGLVPAGEQREFWAWYALPPGTGTRRMAVQVPDQQPIMNIPLM